MRVSKHDQIRAFLEAGTLTSDQIADTVGCSKDYVRAVRLRVQAGGATKADLANRARISERLRTDHDFRAHQRKRKNAWARKHRDEINARARESYARNKSVTRVGAIQGDRAS